MLDTMTAIDTMTDNEIRDEVDSLDQFFAYCRDNEHGISTKESVRYRQLRLAMVQRHIIYEDMDY